MTRACLERPGDYWDGAFHVPAQPEGELRVHSPADTQDLTAIHPYAQSSLEAAVDAARRALSGFRRMTRQERAELLLRYRDRLAAHHDALALVIAREVGKPLWEAKTEVDAMIAKVPLMLGEGARYTEDRVLPELPGEIRHRPHGVIAVIGPFNFPGHLPNGHIVPALLLGNTVVHKPSERTPSTATFMARCFHEAGFPRGAFNMVQGPGSLGGLLASHPDVDGVMFTGSVAVGRRILASQGERIDRIVALELGGKNVSIVLDDCDLERSARALAFAAFATAGQRCTATSRVFVTEHIASALVDRLAEIARNLRVGYPLDADVFMGPVIAAEAKERLLHAVTAAERAGYEAIVPAQPVCVPGHAGHYLAPSLHLAESSRTHVPGYTDEELFGPDLAVHVVRDLDEAIELANASRYGLAAAVFTRSKEAFETAADRLRVGVLHWNRPTSGASGKLPFGGLKDSGNHRPAGILAGTACAYPMALLEAPANEALPSWPGSGLT